MSVTLFPAHPSVEADLPNERQHRRQIAKVLRSAMRGQLNCSLSVTLTESATTTTITDARISTQTCISLMPTTANAANALATTYITCTQGSATITHASDTSTDRTFTAALIG